MLLSTSSQHPRRAQLGTERWQYEASLRRPRCSRIRARPWWSSDLLLASQGVTDPGADGYSMAAATAGDTRVGTDACEKYQPPNSCDQCGETCSQAELAVCKAPGCGVAFAQCERCETDYEGCCSVACQALASRHYGREEDSRDGGNVELGVPRKSKMVPAGSKVRLWRAREAGACMGRTGHIRRAQAHS